MNDNDSKIPVLHHLLYRGKLHQDDNEYTLEADENAEMEIEQDEEELEEAQRRQQTASDNQQDDLADLEDTSVQELIVDEEIRQILDKHMDQAYEEIIRLLSHKIS